MPPSPLPLFPFTSLPLQALPTALEPPAGEGPEDRANAPRSQSSESVFSDFIQYQADRPHETAQAPPTALGLSSEKGGAEDALTSLSPSPSDGLVGRGRGWGGAGPAQTKPQDKPVMQCCLEEFQHFLTRLVTLHVTPPVVGGRDRPAHMEVVRAGLEGGPPVDDRAGHQGAQQRECLGAFTAACQLFLECSSFPVYIAEGNLKSTPTREEPSGGIKKERGAPSVNKEHLCLLYYLRLCLLYTSLCLLMSTIMTSSTLFKSLYFTS